MTEKTQEILATALAQEQKELTQKWADNGYDISSLMTKLSINPKKDYYEFIQSLVWMWLSSFTIIIIAFLIFFYK